MEDVTFSIKYHHLQTKYSRHWAAFMEFILLSSEPGKTKLEVMYIIAYKGWKEGTLLFMVSDKGRYLPIYKGLLKLYTSITISWWGWEYPIFYNERRAWGGGGGTPLLIPAKKRVTSIFVVVLINIPLSS